MSGRPPLLFLCHTLPYPPDGGVWIRTYHVMRLLAGAFDLTALCFERSHRALLGHDVEESERALSAFGAVKAFRIPQEGSRLRWAWDHLRSVATRRPFTVYKHDAREYARALGESLEKQRFALVHVDSLDLSGFLPRLREMSVVCAHHNIESALLRRRAETERARLKRWYIGYQAELLQEEEVAWAREVALNVTVSDADRELLLTMAPGAAVTVVPNGVDTDALRPGSDGSEKIVFVGGSTWYPNRDALAYFCAEILPYIRPRSTARVLWIGNTTERDQQAYGRRYGVELTGYVPDIRPYVQDAGCYVVPIRVGGGTRLKVLDAWAMGRAVVSTSVGCEGLEAEDGENVLIRDDPREFADAVCEVLQSRELRGRLGQNARRTAEEVYSWDRIGLKMIPAYEALL